MLTLDTMLQTLDIVSKNPIKRKKWHLRIILHTDCYLLQFVLHLNDREQLILLPGVKFIQNFKRNR